MRRLYCLNTVRAIIAGNLTKGKSLAGGRQAESILIIGFVFLIGLRQYLEQIIVVRRRPPTFLPAVSLRDPFHKRVTDIGVVEQRDLGGHVVGEVVELTA